MAINDEFLVGRLDLFQVEELESRFEMNAASSSWFYDDTMNDVCTY